MSWHFSQALVEEYLEDNCSDGKLFVPWSSMPSAPDDLCSGKMKGTCHRSPYGMMFVPSTAGPGKELLMWFREVSLARTLVSQDPAQDLMEKEVGCGEKWQGSFVKYDPDSRLWKTPQRSLFGGFTEFSETWPRWGTMRNGECWAQPTWERITNAIEFGSLPTPKASDHKKYSSGDYNRNRIAQGRGMDDLPQAAVMLLQDGDGKIGPQLPEWMMGWPAGWTSCKPLETDKCHNATLKHGEGF